MQTLSGRDVLYQTGALPGDDLGIRMELFLLILNILRPLMCLLKFVKNMRTSLSSKIVLLCYHSHWVLYPSAWYVANAFCLFKGFNLFYFYFRQKKATGSCGSELPLNRYEPEQNENELLLPTAHITLLRDVSKVARDTKIPDAKSSLPYPQLEEGQWPCSSQRNRKKVDSTRWQQQTSWKEKKIKNWSYQRSEWTFEFMCMETLCMYLFPNYRKINIISKTNSNYFLCFSSQIHFCLLRWRRGKWAFCLQG